MVVLRAGFRNQLNSCPDAVSIALRSLQFEFDPVIVAGALVDPDFSGRTQRADDQIQFAVAV